MQFINTILFAATALASMATANTVHFVNQDSTARTIVFTEQSDMAQIESISLEGSGTGNATFPTGWIGNWYSVSEGAQDVPGMLGEVRFDGFGGATFFDVSAIVNPDDHSGVKMIFPKNSDKPVSGCQTFPCANAYNVWDDVATLATDDKELICLVGNLSNERKRGTIARMPREFVTS
ncbi:hypothetical protein BJ875DRAFT_441061 [Amylocarpus encephaloides]|uniref:Dnase1 protein n=1 Tax=Amylocarpus encephaloides TaxID=45428 RepID=A0A9P8C744_9HELO|nr:hypothetical protein BJ875DRAFT_441061 [Amylocarpus encephaloides]